MASEPNWAATLGPPISLNLPPAHRPGVFPRIYIASGERLIFETKPSVFAFVNPVGLGAACVVLAVYLYLLSVATVGLSSSQTQLLVDLLVLVFGGLILAGVAGGLLQWRATSFAVTDRRVMRSKGIVSREAIDCPFDKIQSVALVQGVLARAWGYGNVGFQTAGVQGLFGSAARNVERAGGIYWAGVKDPVRTRRFVEEAKDYFLHQTKSEEIVEMARAFSGAVPQVHVSLDQTPASNLAVPAARPQTVPSPLLFCPRCGTRQVMSAQYCHTCGRQLPSLA